MNGKSVKSLNILSKMCVEILYFRVKRFKFCKKELTFVKRISQQIRWNGETFQQ